MIPVQWSTHNKEELKVCQYLILEEHILSDIIISSFTSSNICWLFIFSSSENWLDLPDPQYMLSSSDSLVFTIYDWYIHFRGFELFCILLGHLCNSAIWVFTFSHLLTLSPLCGDLLGPSDSISLYFLLFPMILSCKFKMFGKHILRTQFFRHSNNKNFIKFVKLK